jgi:hypothetical protein
LLVATQAVLWTKGGNELDVFERRECVERVNQIMRY